MSIITGVCVSIIFIVWIFGVKLCWDARNVIDADEEAVKKVYGKYGPNDKSAIQLGQFSGSSIGQIEADGWSDREVFDRLQTIEAKDSSVRIRLEALLRHARSRHAVDASETLSAMQESAFNGLLSWPRYFVSVLIFLGLIGTVIGLANTIGSLHNLMRPGADAATLIFNVTTPIGGAFTATITGIFGSVTLSLFVQMAMAKYEHRVLKPLDDLCSSVLVPILSQSPEYNRFLEASKTLAFTTSGMNDLVATSKELAEEQKRALEAFNVALGNFSISVTNTSSDFRTTIKGAATDYAAAINTSAREAGDTLTGAATVAGGTLSAAGLDVFSNLTEGSRHVKTDLSNFANTVTDAATVFRTEMTTGASTASSILTDASTLAAGTLTTAGSDVCANLTAAGSQVATDLSNFGHTVTSAGAAFNTEMTTSATTAGNTLMDAAATTAGSLTAAGSDIFANLTSAGNQAKTDLTTAAGQVNTDLTAASSQAKFDLITATAQVLIDLTAASDSFRSAMESTTNWISKTDEEMTAALQTLTNAQNNLDRAMAATQKAVAPLNGLLTNIEQAAINSLEGIKQVHEAGEASAIRIADQIDTFFREHLSQLSEQALLAQNGLQTLLSEHLTRLDANHTTAATAQRDLLQSVLQHSADVATSAEQMKSSVADSTGQIKSATTESINQLKTVIAEQMQKHSNSSLGHLARVIDLHAQYVRELQNTVDKQQKDLKSIAKDIESAVTDLSGLAEAAGRAFADAHYETPLAKAPITPPPADRSQKKETK
jgi:hypothetical protein